MEKLRKIVRNFKGKKILVFGDLMLDEHIWSSVSRISPEAPVPVADVVQINHVPGGAGNVAANISALGGIPILVGIIGRDNSGKLLQKALCRANVSDKYILVDNNRPTILKSRIIAGSQQVVRVDREERAPPSPSLVSEKMSLFKKVISDVDAVIISDYSKGCVTYESAHALINLCQKYKKPVAIDPKGSDYSRYIGATVVTPNLQEASAATGHVIADEKDLIKAGKDILAATQAQYVLITRGKEGMSLFTKKEVNHIPAIPKKMFDITGAGDTVIAALSLALAGGAEIKPAVSLANYAASVVVGKVGTAPCFADELEEAIDGHSHITKKIRSRTEIETIVNTLKGEGVRVVFTNGCFDILHLGHVRYLREAKRLGDTLIVGLNSNSSVKALKGKDRPYVSQLERAEILASLECVDYVTVFSELRPDNLIKIVKPDFHVKGGDYKNSELPEGKLVESFGGKVVIIPPVRGRSTTGIVKKILSKK